MDIFTHDFKFEVGASADQFLSGEVEFNTDGKVSYNVTESSTPLKKETLEHFNSLMELLREIFVEFGGIKRIRIIAK